MANQIDNTVNFFNKYFGSMIPGIQNNNSKNKTNSNKSLTNILGEISFLNKYKDSKQLHNFLLNNPNITNNILRHYNKYGLDDKLKNYIENDVYNAASAIYSTPKNKTTLQNKRNIRVSTPKLYYSQKNPIYKTRVKELGLTNEDNVRSKQLELNAFLKARGLQELNPDGIWGEQTEKAYQLFNSNKNLQSALKPTEVELTPRTITVQPAEYQPGTYNTGYTFNRGNIRANRGINYSNRDQYWNYINNNPSSPDAQLWNNILGGLTNDQKLQAFNQIMDQYGIQGNLGRRDSGRLANLLNDLNLVGTPGSDTRNSFLDSYGRNNRDIVNRTGNDGTIYSSANIKNIFDSIKVNPENNYSTDYNQPIKYDFSTPSLKLFKKGGKNIKVKSEDVCPKCKKIHKMGTGCNVVRRIKYQSGGGLPTAPKAEDRYKNSYKLSEDFFNNRIKYLGTKKNKGVIQVVPYSTVPAYITESISDLGDTIYRESPEYQRFRLRRAPVVRTASNRGNDLNEYETLKRRFNTAWNLAK